MGKTTIYLLLAAISILYVLVTVNIHSQSQLTGNTNKVQLSDFKSEDVIRHKVKSGDSLLSLAYMYRTSAEDIKKLNNITRDDIYLGEILKIPYNSNGYDGENRYIRYKIYQGDSLSELALKFRTDIDSIKQINKLENSQINYGERIEIPYGLKLAGTDTNSQRSGSVNKIGSEYKKDLENKYNKYLNQEAKDSTSDAQVLTDNDNVSANQVYSARKEIYNAEYQDLEKNLKKDLSDRKILKESTDSAGLAEENVISEITDSYDYTQKSSGEHIKTKTEQVISNAVMDDRAVEYVVKSGESLSSIAEEYHATAGELKEFNKMQGNVLQPGQRISIPKYDFIRYRIQKGDNLSTIATINNTTVMELKELNDLKSGNVYIGQRIKIPLENKIDENKIPDTTTQQQTTVQMTDKFEDDDLNAKSADKAVVTVTDEYPVQKEAEEKGETFNTAKISPDETSANKDTNLLNTEKPLVSKSDKIAKLKISNDSNGLGKSNLPNKKVDNKTVSAEKDVSELKSDIPAINLADVKKESTAKSKSNNSNTVNKVSNKVLNDTNDNRDNNAGISGVVVDRSDHDQLITVKENSSKDKQTGIDDTVTLPITTQIPGSYEVAGGDSLSRLAVRFNTTVKEIKTANNLDSNQIKIGQKLVIPSSNESDLPEITAEEIKISEQSDKSDSVSKPNADKSTDVETASLKVDKEITEVDKKSVSDTKGDTTQKLKIARDTNKLDALPPLKAKAENSSELLKKDVSESKSEITAVNTADTNKESISQTSSNNSDGNVGKLSDDELENPEKKQHKNIELVAGRVEESVSDDVIPKETNVVKDSEKTEEVPEKTFSESEISQNHEVVMGDSLSELAVRFNTTVKEIKTANNLDSNQIKIGQKLVIPSSNESDLPEITAEEIKISEQSDKSDSVSKPNADKSTDVETASLKVDKEITEVVKQSESDTDSDRIMNEIKNITAEESNSDKVIKEKADAKEVKLSDNNEVKLSDNIVKQSQTENNVVMVASLDDNTEVVSEGTDNIQNKISENIKPDNETKGTTSGNEEIKVSGDKIKETENKPLQISEYENAHDDLEVKDTDIDKADISNETAVAPVNRAANVTPESAENNISDLEYKADYDTERKNNVTLAQLLTHEQNSLPSEEDRYHTLVEEQVLLTKNDSADRYVQANVEPPSPVEITESGEEIVNFPGEIDLRDLVQTMSEITNESFIVDDKLQAKKVTIITPKGGFSKSNAIRLFEAILDLNGFTVYRSGAVNVVTEKRDIKSVPLPIQEGRVIGTLSERYITQIVPLKNIKAQDVANSLKPLISREGDIVVYEPLNTLIIVETKTNLNKVLTILENIDKEKEIVFVKIYNSDAADISAMLTEIFGGTSASPVTSAEDTDARTRRRSVTRRATRAQQTSAGGEVEITGFKIITDERTNSLIVIAYPEDIPKIKAAIVRLDVQIDEPEHGIYLIRLKNADAEQVVNVLNSLISGVPLTSTTTTEATRSTGRTTQAATQTTSATLADFVIEDVRITADAATNSVIIVGSRREYESIKRVVDEIDIRRKQVYVEAAILEVALDQLKSLGTNLSLGFTFNDDNLGFGGTNLPGIPSLLGAAADSENAVTAVGSLSGMFLGVIGEEVDPDGSGPIPPIPSFTALFQALTSVTDVNILSTPSIVTTDNEEAEIVVADVIPFPTGSTVGDAGVTVQTIDREPVGIRLAITPQIGDGDFLSLQLVTEVSNVRESPPDLNTEEFGITTSTRTATSSVVVKNGQTIVIGGLVQDRESTSENKVPALGDVPILGNLFKFKSRQSQKINLMILLTPRIVDDEKDMRLILEDRQKRNMLLQEKNIDEERLLLE